MPKFHQKSIALTDNNEVKVFSTLIDSLIGKTETPSLEVLSDSTTIAAGAKKVTIFTGSDFQGTILGATAIADGKYEFKASFGNTLGAIAVVRTAGSYTINKLVISE